MNPYVRATKRLGSVLGLIVLAAGLGSSPVAAQPRIDSNALKGLRYRSIGPYRGGRALAVAGVPSEPNVYYFGAVSGGVWKTTDGGLSWHPLFQHEAVSSIGSIAVAGTNPNIIYVGTGEACIRGNITFGDGVYRSLDGGKTWKNVGLKDTRHIGKVIIHPQDPNIVFVAALGHAFGPNEERGIFRTSDGGQKWEKVLYKDAKTGGIDITFDPTNPNLLFASLWEAYRTPWSLSSGGPGSGLYKSTDGGTSWKRLEGHGLPKGIMGRIGVAVSPANPQRVYAEIEAADGGTFRSDDGGEAWRRMNNDSALTQRAWYYMHVTADPKNADTVYVLNTGLLKSVDGGKTFSPLPQLHGDNHGLWIDPSNPSRMINCNDGGANVSTNGGLSWTSSDTTQPTAQFYHVATDTRSPYWVYGAQQDNSTVAIASATPGGGITRSDWYDAGGGESGFVVPDRNDPEIVYAGSYDGLITRYDHRTRQAQRIDPWPDNPMGHGDADLKYRFQWTAPIATSPHDPSGLYHAAQVVFKSVNGGKIWTVISPDLTRNDKTKMGPSGGPITHDNTSVEYYGTIFALAESPKQKDLIWAGSDDGLVHVTKDSGKSWTDATPKALPEWSRISIIDPSPHDPASAYLAANRYQMDDPKPYVYKTNDFGKSWTLIVNGVPSGSYARAVREDPLRKGLLYAGTETGVFVSFDDGTNWQPLQLNLPTSPVHDLVVHDNDLVVATHGRSFWILDDVTPLRAMNAQMMSSNHLFKPADALRRRAGGRGRDSGGVGQNPPTGPIIYYNLKAEPKGDITLDVLDARGQKIQSFSSKEQPEEQPEPTERFGSPRKPRLTTDGGLNRLVWDMRYPGPKLQPGVVFWAAFTSGPLAVPGRYQVRLTVDGQTMTEPFELKPDPSVSATQADLEAQFKLMIDLRDKLTLAEDAVGRIRDVRKQLNELTGRIGADSKNAAIVAAAKELDKKMTTVEEEITQPKSKASEDPLNYPVRIDNKIAAVSGAVASGDAAPTRQENEVAQMLSAQLQEQITKLNGILTADLTSFNDLVRKQNIPVIMGAPLGQRALTSEEGARR